MPSPARVCYAVLAVLAGRLPPAVAQQPGETSGLAVATGIDGPAADAIDASPPGPFREAPVVLPRPRERGVGQRLPDLALRDLDGNEQRFSTLAAGGALVLALRDVDCPVAARQGPRLAELEQRYRERGVAFLYLDASAHDTPDEMREVAQAQGLSGPWVADPRGEIAARLTARTTTEVLVLDRALTLRYRGAIDDQYGIGYSLPAPRNSWLEGAITAVLAGAMPAVAATTAPGCALELPAVEETAEAPTWHGQVSRVLLDACVSCHRAGGAGPFPLDSYEEAAGRRAMLRSVVAEGLMPPWHAEGEPGTWANDRRLASADRELILAWLEQGCVAGDPSLAPLPVSWPVGWQLGEPDLVLENPESYAIPASGVVDYEYSWIQTELTEERWVAAVEIQPGDVAVVHHVLVFLEEPRRPDESDRQFDRRFQGGLDGYFASYVPGQGPTVFGDGLAKRLPARAWIKFQMHYTPNGVATTDRTRVGLHFADGPPLHEVRTNGVATRDFEIPPGDPSYKVRAGLKFDGPSTLLGFSPHMHLRGKAFRIDLHFPDGARQRVLDVPRYDFNWQTMYRLAEPLTVPAGTMVVASAWYDNSADNPANPDPTRTVLFGEQTWDEMMVGFFEWWPEG